ncbi:MAG: TetR/AcrR family transcriptional regulator [Myxococcota bacterium]
MKELILSTALRLFVDESFEGTTMRRIADEIEYTPGAIYSYFKDKDEICYALHHLGFEKLNAMTAEALSTVTDVVERLRVVGQTYIRFAFENRALYDLMFISRKTGKKIVESNEWEPGMRAYGTLRETVQAFVAKFKLDWDVDVTAFGCWSAVHGMVSLVICDRCTPMPVDHVQVVGLAYEQYVTVMHSAARRARRAGH